jgi:hypothetical protein
VKQINEAPCFVFGSGLPRVGDPTPHRTLQSSPAAHVPSGAPPVGSSGASLLVEEVFEDALQWRGLRREKALPWCWLLTISSISCMALRGCLTVASLLVGEVVALCMVLTKTPTARNFCGSRDRVSKSWKMLPYFARFSVQPDVEPKPMVLP